MNGVPLHLPDGANVGRAKQFLFIFLGVISIFSPGLFAISGHGEIESENPGQHCPIDVNDRCRDSDIVKTARGHGGTEATAVGRWLFVFPTRVVEKATATCRNRIVVERWSILKSPAAGYGDSCCLSHRENNAIVCKTKDEIQKRIIETAVSAKKKLYGVRFSGSEGNRSCIDFQQQGEGRLYY